MSELIWKTFDQAYPGVFPEKHQYREELYAFQWGTLLGKVTVRSMCGTHRTYVWVQEFPGNDIETLSEVCSKLKALNRHNWKDHGLFEQPVRFATEK